MHTLPFSSHLPYSVQHWYQSRIWEESWSLHLFPHNFRTRITWIFLFWQHVRPVVGFTHSTKYPMVNYLDSVLSFLWSEYFVLKVDNHVMSRLINRLSVSPHWSRSSLARFGGWCRLTFQTSYSWFGLVIWNKNLVAGQVWTWPCWFVGIP